MSQHYIWKDNGSERKIFSCCLFSFMPAKQLYRSGDAHYVVTLLFIPLWRYHRVTFLKYMLIAVVGTRINKKY